MISLRDTPASRNYASGGSVTTADSFSIHYTGLVGTNHTASERQTRKLDHRLSTLPDGTSPPTHTDLQQVIRRAQSGELSSTEVRSNQIW